jgi:predicted TIM-barrel fold metal-dependent hydrolase
VIPVDPADPQVHEHIADWAKVDGAVGVRLLFASNLGGGHADDPGPNKVLAAAAHHGLPVNIYCSGNLEQAHALIARNPDTRVVIDHLGVAGRSRRIKRDAFTELPSVLALAAFDNVAIKITGACVLSQEDFPFNDIRDPLARIFDAFGVDRCMWGTDWTRTTPSVTYGQSVEAFRLNPWGLSENDLSLLMGETTMRFYDWRPSIP